MDGFLFRVGRQSPVVVLSVVLTAMIGCGPEPDDDDDDTTATALGPVIEMSTDTLDFGTVLVEDSSTLEVSVSNVGDADLSIEAYSWDEIRPEWTLTAALEVIPPGRAYTFTVSWDPDELGESEAQLTIVTDAANTSEYTLLCTGVSYSPDDDGDGYTIYDDDCDDGDPDVNPDATEICNNIDDDCDDLMDNVAASQANSWWVDLDEDGYGDPDKRSQKGCEAPDSTGWADNDGDCDDDNPNANPGTAEACDFIDNDCDDLIDEDQDGNFDGVPDCYDLDGDGYTGDNGDCDDQDPNTHEGAVEIPDNGIDDNCDGNQNENAAPIITFEFPTEKDMPVVPGEQTLEVQVYDYNDGPEDILVQFTTRLDIEDPGIEICTDVVPNELGFAYCTTELEFGRYQMKVSASDLEGATSTQILDMIVDTPPTIEFISPEGGTEVPYGDTTSYTIRVEDPDEQDLEANLTLLWYSSKDGDLVPRDLPDTDPETITVGLNLLSEGEHVITATVIDTLDIRASATVTVIVVPPDCGMNDVIALWHMDEGTGATITDVVHGVTGTASGTTWANTTALGSSFKKGLSFDTEESLVTVEDPDDYLSLGQFTIELWYKPVGQVPGLPVTRQALIYKNGNAEGEERPNYYINVNSSGFLEATVGWLGGGTLSTRGAVEPIETGAWYYFAVTYDGQRLRAFVNGVQDGTADAGVTGWDPYVAPETSMLIGASTDDPEASRPWSLAGVVDELQFMSCATSGDAIERYYLSARPHEDPEIVATPTPGPGATPTPQPVETPTPGPGATPTPQPVETPTPGVPATPTPGSDVTPTPARPLTPTPDPIETPTPGPTQVPTPGPTPQPTQAPTPLPTPTP